LRVTPSNLALPHGKETSERDEKSPHKLKSNSQPTLGNAEEVVRILLKIEHGVEAKYQRRFTIVCPDGGHSVDSLSHQGVDRASID
jgi:hypothetical protein